MTTEEKRRINNAYQRGYASGLGRKWPLHKPPLPPDPIITAVMEAAKKLRDCVDGECAAFEEGDEMAERLYVGVDALDDAMKRFSLWLLEKEE